MLLLVAAAVLTVLVEPGAPRAPVGRRPRNVWVAVTWRMHVEVLATVAIGFPSPLFGVAFVPLFHVQVGVQRTVDLLNRYRRDGISA